MDVEKEITKLDGKKEKLNSQLTRLREAVEAPGYATKVNVLPMYTECVVSRFLTFTGVFFFFFSFFRYQRMFNSRIQTRFVFFQIVARAPKRNYRELIRD